MIKLLKQNDYRLGSFMQESGCFVRSAEMLAELKSNKALTAKQINDLFVESKKHDYLDDDYLVLNSAGIANLALTTLNVSGKFIEVGIFREGNITWYGWTNHMPSYQRVDACIQKIKQNGPQGTHFRVVDNYGNLIVDPHYPDINVKGIYYTILYAYEG